MKKILYIVIGLLVLSGLMYAAFTSQKPSDTVPEQNIDETDDRVRAPENVVLGVGEAESAAGLMVTLNTIVSDSRCPTDVQCVWAGEVTVNLTLQSGSEQTTLDMVLGAEPVTFAGYVISVTDVLPTPLSTVEIATGEYRVTVYVAPVLGSGPSVSENI